MSDTLCECGHWNYDHRQTTGLCEVSYCECKKFELDADDSVVENPWDGDEAERSIGFNKSQ